MLCLGVGFPARSVPELFAGALPIEFYTAHYAITIKSRYTVSMKPKEGRLQTAEHILARTIEHNIPNTKFIISTFKEKSGKIEVHAETDLRKIDLAKLQNQVNTIIQRNLQVNKYTIQRKEAKTEFNLTMLPSSVKEIRIVEIEGFDKTPC